MTHARHIGETRVAVPRLASHRSRTGPPGPTPVANGPTLVFSLQTPCTRSSPERNVSVQFSSNIRQVSNKIECSFAYSEIICVLSSITVL